MSGLCSSSGVQVVYVHHVTTHTHESIVAKNNISLASDSTYISTVHSSAFLMSSTAIYLEFPRSDGSSSKWPLDKLDPTPVNNEVNFMRPVDHKEPLSLKWRVQIGREVAKLLGHAGGCIYRLLMLSVFLRRG
jgi:hypothetical protein